ncbi:MAG: hypothetical protein WBA46_14310 [Thermomicrobiales bacterium]
MKRAYEVRIPLGTVVFDDIEAGSESEARAIALERLVVDVVGDLWTPLGIMTLAVDVARVPDGEVMAEVAPTFSQATTGA